MPGSKSANLAPKEIAKCDNLPEFVTIGCVEVATPEIKDAIHPEIDHYPYIYIYMRAFGGPSRLVARHMLRLLRNQGAPRQPWDHWPAHRHPPG